MLIRAALGVFLLSLSVLSPGLSLAAEEPGRWMSNWEVRPGYVLEVDTSGYRLPVSIAFVPEPGPAPDDPLYFVTELGGRILVVRNDRKVEVFAENFFDLHPNAEMPDLGGVMGLTGLCLEPESGYVFATYIYDSQDGRFNGITRFSTKPGRFSLKPEETVHIRAPLRLGEADYQRLPLGHQIGQCQVTDHILYVGIGDGELTYRARSGQSLFGKVVRMRLDGSPVADAESEGVPDDDALLREYTYASGFRNPFGLTLVGEHIVVADNGPGIDRVVAVQAGADYLYDGSDASIATNAMVVLVPAKGVSNLAFYPKDTPEAIAELKDNLLLVLSGVPEAYYADEPSEIVSFEVDPESALVTSRPRSLVKFVGNKLQVLSSVAIGPDGIYFAPVYGEASQPGNSNVYRLRWAPTESYPTVLGTRASVRSTLADNGCRGCHSIFGSGGNVGPPLNPADLTSRNLERLNSKEYVAQLLAANENDTNAAARAARNRVLAAEGDKRLKVWIAEKIQNPTFDNPAAVMPYLNVTAQQAKIVAKFLLKEKQSPAKKADAN